MNKLFFGNGAPPSGFTASVTLDPLLVNAAAHNFHLQKGSHDVDQGVGNPRPQDAAFDIGAYELTL